MIFFDVQNETALITAYQKDSHTDLLPLMTSYRALLYSLSRRLCNSQAITEELVQSGYIGLIRAAKEFDPARQIRFITYAVPWILGEMRKTLRVSLSESRYDSLDSNARENSGSLLDKLCTEDGIHIEYIDLRGALQQLPKEEYLLIGLRYFRDKTQVEAARMLQKSQSQISRMERHALDTLRQILS